MSDAPAIRRRLLDVSAQVAGVARPRRFLDTEEAADYVASPNRKAFRQWAERADLPRYHRGRRLLFDVDDLDRAVRSDPSRHHVTTLRRAG